jgi:Sortase domain
VIGSRRTAGTALILAGVVAALAGVGLLVAAPRPAADVGAVPAAPPAPPRPATAPAQPRPASSSAGASQAATGPPVRLLIPALHVDARVLPAAVDPAGQLAIPADPRQTGWWTKGAAPGAATGTVVLAGHVDTAAAGPGALFGLRRAVPGIRVHLQTGRHWYAYRVAARRSYPKTRLPSAVFDQAVAPRLALITCGGSFTGGHYEENVVVYAEPVAPGLASPR